MAGLFEEMGGTFPLVQPEWTGEIKKNTARWYPRIRSGGKLHISTKQLVVSPYSGNFPCPHHTRFSVYRIVIKSRKEA